MFSDLAHFALSPSFREILNNSKSSFERYKLFKILLSLLLNRKLKKVKILLLKI